MQLVERVLDVTDGGDEIREGDMVTVDIDERRLGVELSDEEIARRVAEYVSPEPLYTRGVMAKYAATVSSASSGAVTS